MRRTPKHTFGRLVRRGQLTQRERTRYSLFMKNTRKARARKKAELNSLESVEGETRVKVKEMKELAAKRPRVSTKSPIPAGMKIGQFIQLEVQRLLAAQDPKSRDPKTRLQTMLESVYKTSIDMRSGQKKASAELLLNYG